MSGTTITDAQLQTAFLTALAAKVESMDTQHERGLADHSETLESIARHAETARYATSQASELTRYTAQHATGARVDGLFTGERALMLAHVNDAVHAIEDAETALRLARAAIEQLPA